MTLATESSLHLPGSVGFRRLNAAMVLAGLAAFGILYAAQPVLSGIGAEFDVDPEQASLAVSATTGALAVAVVPAAGVAARLGRMRTMRAGLLLAVVLTVLSALAPTFAVLLVLRTLTGLALAGVVAVAMGHVGAEVHPSGLGSAMGLYVAGNSLGGVAGRLVTSGVADPTSWRWGVGALSGFALLATLAFHRLLPDPVGPPATEDVTRTEALGDLLRRPAVWALVLVPFTLMGGFVAIYNYLGYRLEAPPFSLPMALAGLVFLAYLAGSVTSAVAGRLADRWGRPVVLMVSVVVSALGLVLTLPGALWLVILGLVVFTGGFFGAHATASGWAPVVAAPHGTDGSSLYVLGYYAGSSVFGALLGVSWSTGGWSALAGSVGVLMVLGLLAAAYVARTEARRHLVEDDGRAPVR